MAKVSLIPEVLDALVSGLRAYTGGTVTFRAPDSSADGVTVYDGPEWLTDQPADVDGFVVVGYGGEDLTVRGDINSRDNSSSGSGTNTQRLMSPLHKADQEDEIECVAVYHSGGATISAVRAQAFAIVDDVESFLRVDPTLGVPTSSGGQLMWVKLTARPQLLQWLDSGPWCAVPFTLSSYSRT